MKKFFQGCKTQTEKENRVKNIIERQLCSVHQTFREFDSVTLGALSQMGFFRQDSVALRVFLLRSFVHTIENNDKVLIFIEVDEGEENKVSIRSVSFNNRPWTDILEGDGFQGDKDGVTVEVIINGDHANSPWQLFYEDEAYKIAA